MLQLFNKMSVYESAVVMQLVTVSIKINSKGTTGGKQTMNYAILII